MLSEADERAVAAAVVTVPQLAEHRRDELVITRLGGLTNLVFRVEPPSAPALCLRVPGAGTEAYIDRAAECANAKAACRAGVGPDVLYFGDDGVMLMPLLPGQTMSPSAFAVNPSAAGRVGAALKKLHTSGEVFPAKFDLFEQIDKYLRELGSDGQLPDGYHDALKTAQGVRAALSAHALPSMPCHCDPLCENFVDEGPGGVMRIIDFEYGGMNDPLWDVADFIVEAELNAAGQCALIQGYYEDGVPPSPAESGRIELYKAMSDLLWTLWGLVQHKNGNTTEDFWLYSTNRFARCKALMSTPEFAKHVAAVQTG